MHLCLFDIDGTLVETGGAGIQAFRDTFVEDFGVAEVRREIAFAGRSDRAIAMDMLAAHRLETSLANWNRFRSGYLRRLREALPRHPGTVLPGVVELISELADRGDVLIGLLTGNVRHGAQHKLTHFDLWEHFPFGGFGDDHLDRNDIAATALTEAHGHAVALGDGTVVDGAILVLGDTVHDIRCARSIGARVVAVPTGRTAADVLVQQEPDLLVDNLTDRTAILRLLTQSS